MVRAPALLALFATGWCTACCTAEVSLIPKEGGTGEVISTSSKEHCAIEKAQATADEYCSKQGKRYVAVKADSKYQGADPNAKLAVGTVTGYAGNSADDFRFDLEFKCE